MRAVIQGTGMFVPPHQVHNDRLGLVMDTTDEWIQQRTGIVTRHFAEAGVATSDLALPAARQALAQAGLEPNDIDYVVFATMTPDYYFPGSGAVFGGKIGMKSVPCLDIRQQCAGFVYGLQVSDALIRSGQYRKVLLIGAEVHGGLHAVAELGHRSRRQRPGGRRPRSTPATPRTAIAPCCSATAPARSCSRAEADDSRGVRRRAAPHRRRGLRPPDGERRRAVA